MASLEIAINLLWENDVPDQEHLPSASRLRKAIRAAAARGGCQAGEVGLAIVDDPHIHRVNRQHLQHDYPTDVISFPYDLDPPRVEGELVVSWDTARREARQVGWPAEQELLLYVVHGTLHLIGMDDQEAADREAMRRAECEVLEQLGIAGAAEFGPDRADSAAEQG